MKTLFLFITLLFSGLAHAEFGVLANYRVGFSDHIDNMQGPVEYFSGKFEAAIEGLYFYPFTENFKLRTGLGWEEIKFDYSTDGNGPSIVNWENLLLPVDAQYEFGDFYVFGGVVFATNIHRPHGGVGWADTRIDGGSGYTVYKNDHMKVGLELEYQYGTQVLSPPPEKLYIGGLTANAIVRF